MDDNNSISTLKGLNRIRLSIFNTVHITQPPYFKFNQIQISGIEETPFYIQPLRGCFMESNQPWVAPTAIHIQALKAYSSTPINYKLTGSPPRRRQGALLLLRR